MCVQKANGALGKVIRRNNRRYSNTNLMLTERNSKLEGAAISIMQL